MSASTSAFEPKKSPDSISMLIVILCFCASSALVDVHDLLQERHAVRVRALECVPAHDRPERTALREPADLLEKLGVPLGRPARENHDTPPREAGLNAVADALGERADGDLGLL